MSRIKAIDELRDAEVLALAAWIEQSDAHWKMRLRAAWEGNHAARDGAPAYVPALQQLRNRLGPSILQKITTGVVLDAARDIEKNRAAADVPRGSIAEGS